VLPTFWEKRKNERRKEEVNIMEDIFRNTREPWFDDWFFPGPEDDLSDK